MRAAYVRCAHEGADPVAMKNCKECGKSISTDANPCPHCGKKNPHGASKLRAYGIVALVVFVVLPLLSGISKGWSEARARHANASAPAEAAVEEPAIQVDLPKLRADYEANEVAADGIYKGKQLAVTGVVGSIDKDFTDDVVLRLGSANQFRSTNAYMQKSEANAAAALSKGDSVTVVCKGGGYVIGSPVLRSCRFGR
jgi:predicted nucleic acid-binding Zn ribbon protein